MGTKSVIAYFMHETEMASALNVFNANVPSTGASKPLETTESFIVGDIDEAQIPVLKSLGLIVQEQSLPSVSSPLDDSMTETVNSRLLGGAAPVKTFFDGAGSSVNSFPQAIDYYRIWLHGPLTETVRNQLTVNRVILLESDEDNSYKTRLSTQQVQVLGGLNAVAKVQWISPESAEPIIATQSVPGADGQFPASGLKMLAFDARVHTPDERPAVEDWLRANHITIAGVGRRKVRFYLGEGSPLLNELSQLSEVDTVTEYVPPVLFNDYARRLLAVDPPVGAASTTPFLTQDGTGQIVGIADTGIDLQHPDFQGRVTGTVGRGRPGNVSDTHGHGTHVAGSVLGDGHASGGQIKGVAPGAQLFFQSLLDAKGELGGLPVDLNDLFDEAYQAGVRIHNNSWGSQTPSYYTVTSEEVDEFVHEHRDMLIVIAAGNAGVSGQQPKAGIGFVDWLSIGSPASCKNALTVGASRSDRIDGAMSQRTWGSAWPDFFPMPPIASKTISGDPNCLAAFSSRGPCDDRRIKPDVVAPGTDILSALSSLAPITNFWGPYPTQGTPKDPHYAFDGGTSMAAPLVTGCAAIVRQYFLENGWSKPSAALLKATLINSTTWLTGDDATAVTVGTPNYHQGHGRVDMSLAIPNQTQPALELRFKDEWQSFQFVRTGQRKRYQFVAAAEIPELRFCLAYTDAPGRSLQNNLNMFVQHVETGVKYLGNAALPDALTLPDPDNNVECIRLKKAPAGTYIIMVFAANLLKVPQDFALVVTGAGIPPLVEI